ncbi:hypothetical protein ES705_33457 [subsurface metagenome]
MPTSVDISIPKNGVVSPPCPMTNRISHSHFHFYPLPGKASETPTATGYVKVRHGQGAGQHQTHKDKPYHQNLRPYRQRGDRYPSGDQLRAGPEGRQS